LRFARLEPGCASPVATVRGPVGAFFWGIEVFEGDVSLPKTRSTGGGDSFG